MMSTGCLICDESLNSTPETDTALHVHYLKFKLNIGKEKKSLKVLKDVLQAEGK